MLYKVKKIIKEILKLVSLVVFLYFVLKTLLLILPNPDLFLLVTVQVLAWIVAVSILYFNEIKEWTVKNKDILSMLVVVSVLITLAIFFINTGEKRIKAKSALKAENVINSIILDDIIKGVGTNWLYWEYFSIIGYRQNWGYIAQNYSRECAEAYLMLVRGMEIINNMTKAINDSTINQMDSGDLEEQRIKNASSTKKYLDYILSSCK